MADPLSITSCIVAVLQLTATVVEYLNDLRGAAEDRRKVLAEISFTTGLLYMLKDIAEQAHYDSKSVAMVQALQDINEIYECEQPEEPESMEMRLLIYMMGSTWSVKQ